MPWVREFVTSQAVSILRIGLALISIILAFVFFRKSQRAKMPCWAFRNATLIQGHSSRLTDLEVTFKGHRVETLSVGRFLFWNRGNETIDGQDIARVNPLRIVPAGGGQILDAKLLTANNPSSQFSATLAPDGNAVTLLFDYLDQAQGALLQIAHTGSAASGIALVGDIKGARPISKVDVEVLRYSRLFKSEFIRKHGPRKLRHWLGGVIRTLWTLMTGAIAIGAATNLLGGRRLDIGLAGVLLLYTVPFLWLAVKWLRSAIPSGLEAYEGEIA